MLDSHLRALLNADLPGLFVSDGAAANTMGAGAGPAEVADITYPKLGLVICLIAIPVLTSAWLGLKLHGNLLIAGVRCVVQLLLLGTVLKWLFLQESAWLVLLYIGFMLSVTTLEATNRPSHTYAGISAHVFLAIVVPAAATLLYVLLVIVQPPNGWWQAQYAVPLMGMILGNTLNGVSIGLKTLIDGAQMERASLEWALAMGATRWEAIWPLLQRTLRTALTPLLNMLSVAGLVSIPGMMTGQMLAGDDATVAAKYQIMIMYAVAAVSACSCLAVTMAAAGVLLDSQHRLRLDRLSLRVSTRDTISELAKSAYRAVGGALARRQPAAEFSRLPLSPLNSDGTSEQAELLALWPTASSDEAPDVKISAAKPVSEV